MSRFEKSIEVDLPIRSTYNQWTQFETFPMFMEGVERVEQLDDRTLEWTASIGGQERRWTAEIVDQTPDVRIAWKSLDGPDNAGAVLFQSQGPTRTQVTLRIDAEPDGMVDRIGDALGLLERRVEGDLERFKDFIEHQGAETGAWRGQIHGEEVSPAYEEFTGPLVGNRTPDPALDATRVPGAREEGADRL